MVAKNLVIFFALTLELVIRSIEELFFQKILIVSSEQRSGIKHMLSLEEVFSLCPMNDFQTVQ